MGLGGMGVLFFFSIIFPSRFSEPYNDLCMSYLCRVIRVPAKSNQKYLARLCAHVPSSRSTVPELSPALCIDPGAGLGSGVVDPYVVNNATDAPLPELGPCRQGAGSKKTRNPENPGTARLQVIPFRESSGPRKLGIASCLCVCVRLPSRARGSSIGARGDKAFKYDLLRDRKGHIARGSDITSQGKIPRLSTKHCTKSRLARPLICGIFPF